MSGPTVASQIWNSLLYAKHPKSRAIFCCHLWWELVNSSLQHFVAEEELYIFICFCSAGFSEWSWMRWLHYVMRDFQGLKDVYNLPTNTGVTRCTSLLPFTHFDMQQWGWWCHEQVNSRSFATILALSDMSCMHPSISFLYFGEQVPSQFIGVQSRGSLHTRWSECIPPLSHSQSFIMSYRKWRSQTGTKPWVYSVIQWGTQRYILRSQDCFLK